MRDDLNAVARRLRHELVPRGDLPVAIADALARLQRAEQVGKAQGADIEAGPERGLGKPPVR